MKSFFLIFAAIIFLGAGCVQDPFKNNFLFTTSSDQKTTSGVYTVDENNKTILKPLQKDDKEKLVLIPGNYDKMPEVCKLKFNNATPNTQITYSEPKQGLELPLPFNAAWGNSTYTVPPYYEADRTLFFGKISPGYEGGCSLARQFKIFFEEARGEEEYITHLADLGISQKPVKKTINSLRVIEYKFEMEHCNLQPVAFITVLGKKYNYNLMGECSTTMSELEKIVKTMKLID
jgi:hypothetical protein